MNTNFFANYVQEIQYTATYPYIINHYKRDLIQQSNFISCVYSFSVLISRDYTTDYQLHFLLQKSFRFAFSPGEMDEGATDGSGKLIALTDSLDLKAQDQSIPFKLVSISYQTLTLNQALNYTTVAPGELVDSAFDKRSSIIFSAPQNKPAIMKTNGTTTYIDQATLEVILSYLITWGQTVEL